MISGKYLARITYAASSNAHKCDHITSNFSHFALVWRYLLF